MLTNDEQQLPTHVDVVCPTCWARLHPRLKREACQVKCPDCYVQVRVPPLESVLAAIAAERRLQRRDPIGTYTLTDALQPRRELPKSITVICRKCGARLDPVLKAEPRRVRCPDCQLPVAVPSLDEIRRAERRKAKAAKQRPEVAQYVLTAPVEVHTVRAPYLEKQGEIRREKFDPAPQSLFFSNTFTFPWSDDARPRFIFMTIAWTVLGVFFGLMVLLVQVFGMEPLMAAGIFALPALAIGMLAAAYSAACCLPVVTDTAAGADRIDAWPEPVVKEWAVQLLYVSFIGVEAIVGAYFIGRFVEQFTGWSVWPRLLATDLLFPIILLASLEAGSVFTPWSGPIFRSLYKSWLSWLGFYVITTTMWFAFGAVITALGLFVPPLIALLPGPIFAALLLIYARLLGRLAWQASQDAAEPVEG